MVDQTDNICEVLFRIDITVGITVRFAAEQLLGKVYSVYELDYICQIALSINITIGVAGEAGGVLATTSVGRWQLIASIKARDMHQSIAGS